MPTPDCVSIFRRNKIHKHGLLNEQNFLDDIEEADLIAEVDRHILQIATGIGWHIARDVLSGKIPIEVNQEDCYSIFD